MSQSVQVAHGAITLSVIDGTPTTTSNEVARHFGKRHDHVIEKIKTLISDMPTEFATPNFRVSEFTDSTGRKLPAYRLTRDGFTLLAMGFTGKKALAFKLAYIAAFNEMERQLSGKQLPAYSVSPQQALPAADADMLRDLIRRHCETLPKERQADFIIKAWSKLKAHFGCSYREISQQHFTEAMSIVGRHIAEFSPAALPSSLASSQPAPLTPEQRIEKWMEPNGYHFSPEFLARLGQHCIARLHSSQAFYQTQATGKPAKLSLGSRIPPAINHTTTSRT